MENKKNLRIKIKVANRKLKNLNLQLKKTLRKTRKGKTNQIIIVFKKEVFKNLINLKKLNKINIPILILKVQNLYKYFLIGKHLISLERKEYLRILKNKKEKKILKIIFQITSNKNKALFQKEVLKKTKTNIHLNSTNPKIIQYNFVLRKK